MKVKENDLHSSPSLLFVFTTLDFLKDFELFLRLVSNVQCLEIYYRSGDK